jgi:tetratricopeptide (TPR) repeat protein
MPFTIFLFPVFTASARSPIFAWVIIFLFMGLSIAQAAIPRKPPAAGSIINATGDAQIRLVETTDWLKADIAQDLLTGDGLQTGPLGTLALLFADRTQVRVQRNSLLTVKSVAKGPVSGNTVLRLDKGGTWSRAVTGGAGVQIETPSATAAIRGTDWSLTVDDKGSTQLIVLDGEVVLENPYGRVSVMRGEIAYAEIGKAPTKTILVNPQDREQQIYNLSLVVALESFFKLTDLKVAARRQAKERIEMVAEPERTAEQWLDLAELSYDSGDWKVARQALASIKTTDVQNKARAALVAGYLSFVDYDFTAAEQHFIVAEASLGPGRILNARIGRTATLLKLRRSDEAKSLIDKMKTDSGDDPQFLLFQVILTAFSGDFPAAIDQARQLGQRFPDNPAFSAVEGVLSILLARPDQARDAAERALALDPGYSSGYLVIGEYRDTYLGNSEGAVEILRQGLSYNDTDNTLWGGLGFFYDAIGESRLAEKAYLRSIDLNPKKVTSLANYAILLLEQERATEAEKLLQQIEQIDPGRDFTMILAGRLALQKDSPAEAKEGLLKATTLNPAYSDSSVILGQAYYQEGELAPARQALDSAGRMNPNDPLIPLIGSVIASDQAHADQAIELAREAMRLYRQRGGEGITGLASTRGGNNTLGSAFADLGLSSWANYYNELSFDPYSAESHFYRAAHDSERFSSLFQGLLLEPLATSGRNRFVDFYRRPFTDSEIGGTIGWPGNGTSYQGEGTVQGFARTPKPMSYYLTADYGHSPEDRDHADYKVNSFVGGLGVNITPHDRLFLDAEGVFTTKELPGSITLPDPDDERDSELVSTGLGYSHYFGARNILLGRIMAQDTESTVSNALPLGSTPLSDLEYSMVYNFGSEAARYLYEWGLRDDTDPSEPDSPLLTVGDSGPYLSGAFLDGLDPKQDFRIHVENRTLNLNVRHLLAIRSVDFTYGAELQTFRQKVQMESLVLRQRDPGTGLIMGPGGSAPFLFGDPAPQSQDTVENGIIGSAYLDALWRLRNTLWFSGSLFADHADREGSPPINRLDPRVGAAWQASARDWLRLAFREDLRTSGLYSLSPVATVGFMPQLAYLGDDGKVASYIARWDREWSAYFFTAFELRRQDIENFSTSVPDSFMFYSTAKGRIDQASLAANLWLRGGFGLFAQAVWRDTEDRSEGVDNYELPLIPEQQLDAGITWIHPLQIRLNLVVHLVDERPAYTASNTMLAGYETVDIGATWQPLAKHLELGLAVANLLDREYEIGPDFPAGGRNVLLTAKWRF